MRTACRLPALLAPSASSILRALGPPLPRHPRSRLLPLSTPCRDSLSSSLRPSPRGHSEKTRLPPVSERAESLCPRWHPGPPLLAGGCRRPGALAGERGVGHLSPLSSPNSDCPHPRHLILLQPCLTFMLSALWAGGHLWAGVPRGSLAVASPRQTQPLALSLLPAGPRGLSSCLPRKVRASRDL